MKSVLISLLVGAVAALDAVQDCNPLPSATCTTDNCLRTVEALQAGYVTHEAHLSDCTSYLKTTVIPPTVSIRVTVPASTAPSVVFTPNPIATVAATRHVSERGIIAKRTTTVTGASSTTVIPTSIPFYASTACEYGFKPLTARYSSACSCDGATSAITTVPAATVSSTTTVYATTVTLGATFVVAATDAAGSFMGYLADPFAFSGGSQNLYTSDDISAATPLKISTDRASLGGLEMVQNGDVVSEQNSGAVSEPVWFASPESIASNHWAMVTFAVHPDLSITAENIINGFTTLQLCGFAPNLVLDITAPDVTNDNTGSPCVPVSLTYVDLPAPSTPRRSARGFALE